MAQYDYIRYLYYNEGISKREIARRLKVHRNTVTRAVESNDNKYNLTAEKDKPVNGPFKSKIELMVKENINKPRKHKLTKTRMYELMSQEGYEGSYSAFTYQVRQTEKELNLSNKDAFIKLVPARGVMQVDFGEMTVMDKGIPKKVHAFCCKLSYEKAEFVQVYPRQSTEFFFDGLNRAFTFFGGIPKKIVFDNLKPAVKDVLTGTDRILQENFLKFKSFYAFDAVFCGPGKGNEKGMVENLVKYVRNNYFLPYPNYTSFDELNSWLIDKCNERMRAKKVEGITWQEQLHISKKDNFLTFIDLYDVAKLQEAKVDTYQLIHVDKNRYSVPTQYVGEKVLVKIYPFKIVVIYDKKVIAEHERLFAKNKDSLNPYHFLDLLSKKSRAYDDAKVIKEWKLPCIFEEYHRKIQAHRNSKSKGTREFIDILKLTKTYGVKRIQQIIQTLDSENRYSYEEVISVLRYQEDANHLDKVLSSDVLSSLGVSNITSSFMPLVNYESLVGGN